MNNQRYPHSHFSEDDISQLSAAMKVGLLATVNPAGQPHLTMISTLMAADSGRVAWGQFTEGLSKVHVRQNSQSGFLIMTLDRKMWRGAADYTEARRDGREYNFYNNIPMFRYNAYFGIHTVHYMNLAHHTGPQPLPMNRIVMQAALTLLARRIGPKPLQTTRVLNSWSHRFINKLENLKFLSFIRPDGYPAIVPVIQAQALDAGRVLFSTGVYTDELSEIPVGTSVAVFCLSLSMEDVLLRGRYRGVRRLAGVPCGIIDLEWAYNSMPPVPGQIYPPVSLNPVRKF